MTMSSARVSEILKKYENHFLNTDGNELKKHATDFIQEMDQRKLELTKEEENDAFFLKLLAEQYKKEDEEEKAMKNKNNSNSGQDKNKNKPTGK
jgi:predicted transcriptional regulator